MTQKPVIGISECLLGHEVRYDGGHKRDRYITETLGPHVTFVSVCPEVEAGFGVPREPMRLEGDVEKPRLVTLNTHRDLTDVMRSWAAKRVRELEGEGLCGFIFKSRSPSSGMERVKVYSPADGRPKNGSGIFARAFMEHFPLIPVEDEGRLHDAALRENFIESVFVMKRWREFLGSGRSMGQLVDFHTRHKLVLMSHSPKHYTETGRFVSQAKKMRPSARIGAYENLLFGAMKLKPTAKKHSNVLMHMMGYFKKKLSRDEKEELAGIISIYADGHVPLIVPVTLINHYVRKYDEDYLKKQYYLNPCPAELHLRNHA